MKRVFDHPFERDLYEELAIPTGEFVALSLATLLLLGLFLGPSTLPEVAKTLVADVTAALSHASTSLESSMEARASQQRVRDVKERAIASTWHPTRMSGHHRRHRGHHGHACLSCKLVRSAPAWSLDIVE
jgi:hypothetical protein